MTVGKAKQNYVSTDLKKSAHILAQFCSISLILIEVTSATHLVALGSDCFPLCYFKKNPR